MKVKINKDQCTPYYLNKLIGKKIKIEGVFNNTFPPIIGFYSYGGINFKAESPDYIRYELEGGTSVTLDFFIVIALIEKGYINDSLGSKYTIVK